VLTATPPAEKWQHRRLNRGAKEENNEGRWKQRINNMLWNSMLSWYSVRAEPEITTVLSRLQPRIMKLTFSAVSATTSEVVWFTVCKYREDIIRF